MQELVDKIKALDLRNAAAIIVPPEMARDFSRTLFPEGTPNIPVFAALDPSDVHVIFSDEMKKLRAVVEAAKNLKPLQPCEVKLGGELCLGFDDLCIALKELEKK